MTAKKRSKKAKAKRERKTRAIRRSVRESRQELLKPPALPNADAAVAAVQETEADVKARMGRPPIQINWQKFEDACGDWGTLKEIAAKFRCSPETLERKCHARYGMTFADVSGQLRAARVGSLRRASFIVALKGNPTMLKHLLNNYGGTADILRLRNPEQARKELAEILGVNIEDIPPHVVGDGQ